MCKTQTQTQCRPSGQMRKAEGGCSGTGVEVVRSSSPQAPRCGLAAKRKKDAVSGGWWMSGMLSERKSGGATVVKTGAPEKGKRARDVCESLRSQKR